jgi:pyruvate/2-oxoglutarate/acetoin dehydrogenase E1 component
MTYFEELRRAMEMIAEHPRSVFMGQAVGCAGTAMSRTLETIPHHKKLEMPVMEDCQMGMATGMAINGELPVCIFPRWNFLLLAINQLVLHLDKLPVYSRGGYKPCVIIRTAIGTREPMDPGPQHLGDYTDAVRKMLMTVQVVRLDHETEIMREYGNAMKRETSTLFVEDLSKY